MANSSSLTPSGRHTRALGQVDEAKGRTKDHEATKGLREAFCY